ncbi:MAG: tricarboxylate transporter, partial [Gammaproteobacteria bacterium]|nr:tricarboxylate transporter [Gammaproteobacteria bacterium]
RYSLMAPFMIMVICFAAFQATRALGDLAALFAIGVLGVLMKRFGWPRPAFLIGFVLAGGMETYLYQAVQFDGWGFLLKPGVLIIAALTAVSIYFAVKKGHSSKYEEEVEHLVEHEHAANLRPQLIFAGAVFLMFAYGLYDALQQSFLGGVFPGAVCAAMLIFSGVTIYKLYTGKTSDPVNFDNEVEAGYVGNPDVSSLMHYIWWLVGFGVACYLLGYMIAITLFFLVFLTVKAQTTPLKTAILTICGVGFLVGLAHFMVLDFPRGLLQDLVDLPWPIG